MEPELLKAVEKRPVSVAELHEVVRDIAKTIREFVDAREAALAKRLDALEQRRAAMVFLGPHDPGRTYRQGDTVQRASALYTCLASMTTDTPGASNAWRQVAICR